jgi:hypothetical protein
MMSLTPSSKSSFLAGMALMAIGWLTLLKLDSIPLLRRVVKKDRVLDWMTNNKSLTLIGTEVMNFGTHGITNSNSVTFALGSTLVNMLVIFLFLPFRRKAQNNKINQSVANLRGVKPHEMRKAA